MGLFNRIGSTFRKAAGTATFSTPVPHDSTPVIQNQEILDDASNFYIPRWNEVGMYGNSLASRRGQCVYRNWNTKRVINPLMSSVAVKNIADGLDPNGYYRIKDVPMLNVGSNGILAWWKFAATPDYMYHIPMVSPVVADRNLQQYILHPGIDFNSSPKYKGSQLVRSAYAGVVHYVGFDATSGHYLMIRHTFNGHLFYTLYMHLSKGIYVKVGDEIQTGACVATVGNTGSASSLYSCHLHFEVRGSDGITYYDPVSVIGVVKINRD